MRLLKKISLILMAFFLVLTITIAGIVSALNTKAGQDYAIQKINHFGRSSIHIDGLSGSFPYNMKLQNLQLIDTNGVWLNATQIKLQWSPFALLRRHLAIQNLTAQTITFIRPPISESKKTQKTTNSGFSVPRLSLTFKKLEVGRLTIGPQLTGKALEFHVTGHASLPNFHNANIAFNATSTPDVGSYLLIGKLTPNTVLLNLSIHEKPFGLIGHIIDPTINQPLDIKTTIIGPRNKATLNGLAQFGLAKIEIDGFLGLNQAAPYAKVDIVIPRLKSLSALDGLKLDGSSQLNFAAEKALHQNMINFSVKGFLTLSKTPPQLKKILIGNTTLNAAGFIKNYLLSLKTLTINSPGFNFSSAGTISKKNIDLESFAQVQNVSDLFPNLKGKIYFKTKLSGPLNNFKAKAELNGQILPPDALPEPFSIALHAWSLPNTPYGNLQGHGSFASAPLSLRAKFFYNEKSTSRFELKKLIWKSLTAHADLKIQAGNKLPAGTANVNFSHLSDLNPLLGQKISGAINANFSYQEKKKFDLNATVKNVNFEHKVSDLNANLNAFGKPDAIAIKINAHSAKLIGQPANVTLAGNLNLAGQTINLNSLNGDWSGLHAVLLAPALFEIKPNLAIEHLNLKIDRADVLFDGTLSPTLDAKASIKDFDLSMLHNFSKNLNYAGLINLNADLTGLNTAPQGQITIKASGLRYLTPKASALPDANLSGIINLKGRNAEIKMQLNAGNKENITLHGNAPLSMDGPLDLNLKSNISASLLSIFLSPQNMNINGELLLDSHLAGTPKNPSGFINLKAQNIHAKNGIGASIPAANLIARADIKNESARLNIALNAGPEANFITQGTISLMMDQEINLQTTGRVDLKLLNPIFAASGSLLKGNINTQFSILGTLTAPQLSGSIKLSDGSILNVFSGLNLTSINATVKAENQLITLQNLSAVAGRGKITGYGNINLAASSLPIDVNLNAEQATPIASDLLTETLNAALTLNGGLKTGALLSGDINILKANINIPRSLPPSIANLPIHYEGDLPGVSKDTSSSLPPISLDLNLKADNQIFVRGDGLFAELGGRVVVNGTSSQPIPTGGFSLVRGSFSLAGKTLQFTQGNADFNGDGFIPALHLEATTPTSNGGSATLTISGTASKPKINLSSSPPLPSDEILSQLLFAQNSNNLSPFQAASLATALAQISGVGGGFSPFESTRHALGLDELSIGSNDKGGASVQAGRYVAPGIYVGASQSATGQGSKANVEINLYKGLKLQSSTGTDSTGQSSSSVGLGYQFNY